MKGLNWIDFVYKQTKSLSNHFVYICLYSMRLEKRFCLNSESVVDKWLKIIKGNTSVQELCMPFEFQPASQPIWQNVVTMRKEKKDESDTHKQRLRDREREKKGMNARDFDTRTL